MDDQETQKLAKLYLDGDGTATKAYQPLQISPPSTIGNWPTTTTTTHPWLTPPPKKLIKPHYHDLTDTPEIELSFLSEETRSALVWTPAVGRRVVFGTKNGVVRTGVVSGISVLKPSIRHVTCDVGNPVFIDFQDTDWYYEGTVKND